MSKESLFSLAIILTIIGISVVTGHPAWGGFTGAAILLLAGGVAAGALKARSQSEYGIVERALAGQKISSSLVTLSSAAILAVYAAGYHRTGSAAEGFAAQAARRRTAAPMEASASAAAPKTATSQVEATPAVRPSLLPPRRTAHPRASSPAVPNAVAPLAPVPAEDSPATASAAAATTPTNHPVAAPAAPDAVRTKVQYKDGTYLGWGSSRHGDIQASVVIQGGQIASAVIAQCLTRYSCSWIAALPGQVVSRQSANVDYVSGATESSNAFYDAISRALSQASE